MRKALLTIALLAAVACSSEQMKYGQGGRNACQFIKEQLPGLRDDIKTIEVIGEDSLLSDIGLTFASLRAGYVKTAYYEGRTSYEEMDRVLDSCWAELMFVEQSWKYGTVSKKVEKFRNQWRKVYTVRATLKSGDTRENRVLMDKDGVTPRKLESDFLIDLTQYYSIFSY